MATSALVIGCGYLGRRVADAWRDRGRTVYAMTRTRADELTAVGLVPVIADVTAPNTLKDLPQVDTVLYAVGWDRTSDTLMRTVYVKGLNHVLDALPKSNRF